MPKIRRIEETPLAERPREKLQRYGAAALSDFELLELLIGTGAGGVNVGQLARTVQRLLYRHGGNITLEQLSEVKGVSIATASRVLGGLELARRHLVRDLLPLRTQDEILGRLADIRTLSQEHFICLSLDGGQRLIARRTITIGLLDSVQAHPREVFADAIADRAASVVIAHNHPSGDATPSQRDITCTQQLAAAGQLLGIPLRDHLILTKTEDFSFAQHHLY
ncbi:MAG TPA: DNA repair protein RadC [Candidatus Saccharimonadales bacterium]